jgi:hypothetical protein
MITKQTPPRRPGFARAFGVRISRDYLWSKKSPRIAESAFNSFATFVPLCGHVLDP